MLSLIYHGVIDMIVTREKVVPEVCATCKFFLHAVDINRGVCENPEKPELVGFLSHEDQWYNTCDLYEIDSYDDDIES